MKTIGFDIKTTQPCDNFIGVKIMFYNDFAIICKS